MMPVFRVTGYRSPVGNAMLLVAECSVDAREEAAIVLARMGVQAQADDLIAVEEIVP